ncbi:unnamed protein product [Dovyalis caffra]|uniref:Uncharacterized protein n=1 Tax=Dovyalis caffra TaxID=77055 RepID=A0AAV1QUP3_9ROSI|nr:unnamed protein product [Dovyalis caffra]
MVAFDRASLLLGGLPFSVLSLGLPSSAPVILHLGRLDMSTSSRSSTSRSASIGLHYPVAELLALEVDLHLGTIPRLFCLSVVPALASSICLASSRSSSSPVHIELHFTCTRPPLCVQASFISVALVSSPNPYNLAHASVSHRATLAGAPLCRPPPMALSPSLTLFLASLLRYH